MIVPMFGTPHVETTHRGRLLSVEVLAWADADGREVRREVVRHPGAVVIVPVLDDGRLVLAECAREHVARSRSRIRVSVSRGEMVRVNGLGPSACT